MPMAIENNNDLKSEIRIDPAIFSFNGDIEIFSGDDKTEKNNIKLTLYDGSVVKHWYWGNLAFDLTSMRLAKKRVPILDAHDTDRPIGYSTSASFDPKFILEGKFLKNNPLASTRQSELDDGFPYESSLRFDMEKSTVELVREGESAEVNGQVLKGPGAVIRKAVIMEGSMCVFGALNNCKTENFENVIERFERKSLMTEKTETLTIETFEKDNPALFKKIFDKGIADGEKKERDLFAEIKTACGGDHELTVEMFESQKTKEEALQARNDKLQKEIAEMKAVKPATPPAAPVDPAKSEFSDGQEKLPVNKPASEKTEDELKAEFAASKDLQTEFGKADAYVAYIEAAKKGQVDISKKE